MKKQKDEYTFTFMALRKKMKILLGALAVLIGFAFVFGGLTRGCDSKTPENLDQAGTLFGEPVSYAELAQAKRHAYMASPYQMLMLPADERDKELEKSAWERLACLRYARRLGIQTGPDELRQTIKQTLSSYGPFNEAAYSNMVSEQFGSPQRFEEYYQQELTLEKLGDSLSAAALVAPSELSRHINNYTDTFKLQYATLESENFTKKVKVSDDEARKYLEDNEDMFVEPERMRVIYVSFPVSNYLDGIEVSEFDMEDYYDRYQDDKYSIKDTNGFVTTNIPFEEVKDEIGATLKYQAAAETAYEYALDFVFMLAPQRDKPGVPFPQAASATNLALSTSAYFAVDEELEEIDAPLDFSEKAFELVEGDPERYFSTPIEGPHHVFVAAYHDTMDSHMPEFDKISKRVREMALAEKKVTAMEEKADEIRESLSKAIEDDKTFEDAAKRLKLKAMATESFDWLTVPTNVCNEVLLWQSVISRQQGEITEPIPTTNGVVIAYLEERKKSETPPDRDFVMKLVEELRSVRTRGLYELLREQLSEAEDLPAKVADYSDEDEGSARPDDATPGNS